MDIKSVQKKLSQFADERDWNQFHNPKNLSIALAVEASELMEIFQWLTDEQSREIVKSEKQMALVREEMADVFLFLLRLADKLDVDLEKAAVDKIAINSTKYPVELSKGNAKKYNRRDT